MDYFEQIVSHLSLADLQVLGVLQEKHIDSLYKSVHRNKLQNVTQLSTFKLNRSLDKLTATSLIAASQDTKSKSYYITEYGKLAVQESIKGETDDGQI